jgi:hypothetical protein
VGGRRRRLQPGQEAGERRLAHGQFHRLGLLAGPALHHDQPGAQAGRLGGLGFAPGGDRQHVAGEDLVGAQQQPEDLMPAQLVRLVGSDAQPPGAVPARPPQAAFDGAAAALDQRAPPGHGDSREHDTDQD